MANGRKHKGGTSILKRLAGGNGDKTKVAERRMPRGDSTPTERSRPERRATYLKPAPERGRHERYRTYEAAKSGRERKPKVEREEHRKAVEEHKKKHRPGLKEGEHWML